MDMKHLQQLFTCVCVVLLLQIVLENSSREDKHECPFGRCAIELTRMLCEILQVGELRESSARLPHTQSLPDGSTRLTAAKQRPGCL